MVRVTGLWNDGLDIIEEHPTWGAAQNFIGELMGAKNIIQIVIEKDC